MSKQIEKSNQALKTIGEAAEAPDLPQHVLRFWETKFYQISPLKRRGGRRFYRPKDIKTLQTIKHLLHEKNYTIKGALAVLDSEGEVFSSQKDEHKEQLKPVEKQIKNDSINEEQKQELCILRNQLIEIRNSLKNAI